MFQSAWVRHVFAFVLLAAVLAVWLSPAVDLQESALRAKRIASLFFWLLATVVFLRIVRPKLAKSGMPVRKIISEKDCRRISHFAIVDRTCARLI